MKIVTLGELMLRLSPPGFLRLVQSASLDATFGGGEANVAASLANFRFQSYFVTKLPATELGQAAVNHLRRYGIDTSYIVRGGDRLGIYFLETGASQRPSKVIYDRKGSAITGLTWDEVDWSSVFDGATWFHWTGITPALGPTPRKTLQVACEAAKSAGVTVSCDLNYRKKLWSEEEARATMKPLMQYVDVCIANEEDPRNSLGMGLGKSDAGKGDLDEESYFDVARKLKEQYDFRAVAITLRESYSASRNGWSAVMLDDADCREPFRSGKYEIQIVDRVGGGDAFAGGLIAGLLREGDTRDALEFAVAASCLKQTIPGDFNHVSVDEVRSLVAGGGSGRVER